MGAQSLRDSAGVVGAASQVLSAGAGGLTLWTTPAAAGVASVAAGTNISIPNPAIPIVGLQSPLTATLNIGAQAITDSVGSLGLASQVLTAGAGSLTLWSTPTTGITSVAAGTNISIPNPAIPIVAIINPLNATINFGTQALTDRLGSIGLASQVLTASAVGGQTEWRTSATAPDLQTVCNVGSTTTTNVSLSAGDLIFGPTMNITSATVSCPIKIGEGVGSLFPTTICIGSLTGSIGQGGNSIAIGEQAGQLQGNNSIAVGFQAGFSNQGDDTVAIGNEAGANDQGVNSIAIGSLAGLRQMPPRAVAIGTSSLVGPSGGFGTESVAIGYLAQDTPPLFDNNIIINASGVSFPDLITYPVATGGRCYIGSLAKDDGTHVGPNRAQAVFYDALSGELYWV
jgi:hypothetical protein